METKRKRGRPRKNQVQKLPEEIKSLVDEVQEKQQQLQNKTEELHSEVEKLNKERLQNIQKESKPGEWDVKIGDPIDYFDKRLSYEITGYRPINETQGLDFNPKWFTEARDTKIETGHYTSYYFGSKAYRDFWNEEYKRCREGYTVNGYTIPGTYYYFLNYYQLPSTETSVAGAGRKRIFPKFFVYQYEFFHYFELCRHLRMNLAEMKNRGCKP